MGFLAFGEHLRLYEDAVSSVYNYSVLALSSLASGMLELFQMMNMGSLRDLLCSALMTNNCTLPARRERFYFKVAKRSAIPRDLDRVRRNVLVESFL